uniref:Ubiquitin carboxyl-terminal hydrolase n=1 Tax=Mucochytrium quahogii TaxID=96639 RepID=A0A7S2RQP1_9STRA
MEDTQQGGDKETFAKGNVKEDELGGIDAGTDPGKDEVEQDGPGQGSATKSGIDMNVWEGPLKWTPSIAVGLANLGNTCYLNSIVQALLHCPSLVAFFSHNWPNIAPIEYHVGNRQRNDFTNDFSQLIRRVWSGGVNNERLQHYFNPMSVVKGVIRAVPEFRENGQQDAQEALNYILNNLHDELAICVPAEYNPARKVLLRLENEQREADRSHKSRKCSNSSVESMDTGTSVPVRKRKKRRSKFRMRGRHAKSDSKALAPAAVETLSVDDVEIHSDPKFKMDEDGDNEEEEDETEEYVFRQLKCEYLQSIISDTFQTLLVQRVMCRKCGYSSLSLEEYFEMSLALPSKAQLKELKRLDADDLDRSGSQREHGGSSGSLWGVFKNIKTMIGLESQVLSLRECLQGFFAPEQLQGDEQYYCEKCKSKQDAEKSHSFAHLPEVLCLNLKRFNRNLGGWSLNSYKNMTSVTYPLRNLDLSDFFYDKYGSQQEEASLLGGAFNVDGLTVNNTHAQESTSSSPESREDDRTLYDLFAVVRHSGGINGGHYIAYCKNPINLKWYEYDDDICSVIPENKVQSDDAYLLFYRKQKNIDSTSFEKKQGLTDKLKAEHALVAKDGENPIAFDHYISQYWTLKWDTLVNPGVCGAFDCCCPHGMLLPLVRGDVQYRLYRVSAEVWNLIDEMYGCGPHLESTETCEECLEKRNSLIERRENERRIIREARDPDNHYLIHNGWVRAWTNFINNGHELMGRGTWMGVRPPGKISNDTLLEKDGETPKPGKRKNTDYRFVNKEIWDFFLETYGGGPELYRKSQDLYGT